MAQIQVPDSPKEYVTHYEMLLGVDFQADQTQVDRRRSPDMVNMISDFGGNPVKRDGFRRVGGKYAALVTIDGQMYGVQATDTLFEIWKLYYGGYEFTRPVSPEMLLNKNVGTIRAVFTYQHTIYVIATKCMISYDTESKKQKITGVGDGMMSTSTVGESAPTNPDDVPLTVYKLKPDGTDGQAYYDKNLTSIYQQVSYAGDGTSTAYKIPNYKKIGTWVKAEVKDANGDWQTATASVGTSSQDVSWKIDGSNTTVLNNIVDPIVTITPAPSAPATGDGSDNVRITFCPYSMEQIELYGGGTTHSRGYYNEAFSHLLACQAATFQSNRMFIADKYKIYYSEVSNPFYISDLSWFEVDSEVTGFTRSNSYLAILTRDTGRSTIYLATEESRVVDSQTGEKETYFAVKESNSGIGAIAPKCISTLSDEPMFLSKTGIFGILTNWTSEKYAVNRSSRINRRLCKEPNLESAVGIAFNDYFYLSVNGRMYVLDGRHKESDRAGNKPLEAYVFEGLPAIENMWVVDGRMYFADDTKTYTWNDDLGDAERYLDCETYAHCMDVLYGISDSYTKPPTGTDWSDEEPTPAAGEVLWFMGTFDDLKVVQSTDRIEVGDIKMSGDPVCARWCSVFDDDDAPQRLKTLMKKGTMITLVPHFKSGCEITLIKDGDQFEYLGSFDSSLTTFESIDFNSFTFNANPVAFDNFTKKKIKKYKRLQIQVENNNAEPFGITQIIKTYTIGNYAKR